MMRGSAAMSRAARVAQTVQPKSSGKNLKNVFDQWRQASSLSRLVTYAIHSTANGHCWFRSRLRRTLVSAESSRGQRRADRGESQQAADAQEHEVPVCVSPEGFPRGFDAPVDGVESGD